VPHSLPAEDAGIKGSVLPTPHHTTPHTANHMQTVHLQQHTSTTAAFRPCLLPYTSLRRAGARCRAGGNPVTAPTEGGTPQALQCSNTNTCHYECVAVGSLCLHLMHDYIPTKWCIIGALVERGGTGKPHPSDCCSVLLLCPGPGSQCSQVCPNPCACAARHLHPFQQGGYLDTAAGEHCPHSLHIQG